MRPADAGPGGPRRPGQGARTAQRGAGHPGSSGRDPADGQGTTALERVFALAADWGPVAARVLLALVLAWFGYHELVHPGLWTGYVPLLAPRSTLAIVAVLAHGWVLLMLAVALAAGIAPRLAALVAAVVVLEIVVSLIITAGLSDLTLRDLGVLGLAVSLTGVSQHRWALRR